MNQQISGAKTQSVKSVDPFFKPASPLAADRSSAAAPRTCLILAMTPRCGSTYLGQLMQQTRQLGTVEEYFNPHAMLPIARAELNAGDALTYVHALIRARASANGVFSAKTTFEHVQPFLQTIGAASLRFSEVFPRPRFVYLGRKNVLAQAVSLVRAAQSGLWHKTARGDVRTAPRAETLSYDAAAISRALEQILRGRLQWDQFFASAGIKPLRLNYERVVAEPLRALAQIAEYLEQPIDVAAVNLDTANQKLADELNRSWERRFLREHRI